MKQTLEKTIALKGGEWLIKEEPAGEVFIPEEFSEEHKLIKETCAQFMGIYVTPQVKLANEADTSYMKSLIQKAADHGILAASFPEKYGGLGKDIITTCLIRETIGPEMGFMVSFGVHSNLATTAIIYFGSEEQKSRYVPKLMSAEWIASYALTEANNGSDALGIKSVARLSEDGKHFILNGQKSWITNGGIADIYVVFAQVVDEKLTSGEPRFTAFIVERGFEGFSQGVEEHKMGIKNSSTIQLFFEDCKIPVENILGKIGNGHFIAFNIFNGGRLILAAASVGGSKVNLTRSIQYAVEREQFKTSIANFGAIKHKLAEMAIRIWVTETVLYRTCKWIRDKEIKLAEEGESLDMAFMRALEEFALECSALKIKGTEVIDFVVDEALQIHGGNGFSSEYEVSKAYRDCRIFRIFEGTNEINRMIVIDMLAKKVMKGNIDLVKASMSVYKELIEVQDHDNNNLDESYVREKICVKKLKKAFLLLIGAASQKLGNNMKSEQEVVMSLTDILIDVLCAESALLRVIKLHDIFGAASVTIQEDIMRTYLYDAADRINKAGKDTLNAFAEGDELKMMHIGLNRFTKVEPFNTKAARRRIAEKLIAEKSYCF